MAFNPQLGDVRFEVGSKSYVIRLGFLGLSVLENETGTTWTRFFQRPQDQWGVKDMRDIFISALAQHHPELKEREVCDIIDELGLAATMALIGKVMVSSSALKGGDAADSAANPPMNGIGG